MTVANGGSVVHRYFTRRSREFALYVDLPNARVRHVGNHPFYSSPYGSEYTLSGAVTGPDAYRNTWGQVFDAAYDGVNVYTILFPDGAVFIHNKDYTNPQFLFRARHLGRRPISITYDSETNTLWTGDQSGTRDRVNQWALDGTHLKSTTLSGDGLDGRGCCIRSLAYDRTDDTFWCAQILRNSVGDFYWANVQFDRDGNVLSHYRTDRAPFGGEFAMGRGNAAPTIDNCPDPVDIGCNYAEGVIHTVTVEVSDADNDALTTTWTVTDASGATSTIVRTLPAGTTAASLTDYAFPFGANTVELSVTDGQSDPATCTTVVTVVLDGAPVPDAPSLAEVRGQCSATIDIAPTATVCSDGSRVVGTATDQHGNALGTVPITFSAQGTYVVTWTYRDPNAPDPGAANATSTQTQTVIVEDTIPPVVTCPPAITVAYGTVPAAPTTIAEFEAQGGSITDNCDPNGQIVSEDFVEGFCPTIVTRCYEITDAAGNLTPCVQVITVDNLFPEDAILWHQPLARKGMSEDTDPSDGGTLKFRFKLGRTIPVQVHAIDCVGNNISGYSNVAGTVTVYGDADCDGLADGNELAIDYNGVGGAGGLMDKVDGHLKYNLDTGALPVIDGSKSYILEVTVEDINTGESRSEQVRLQAK